MAMQSSHYLAKNEPNWVAFHIHSPTLVAQNSIFIFVVQSFKKVFIQKREKFSKQRVEVFVLRSSSNRGEVLCSLNFQFSTPSLDTAYLHERFTSPTTLGLALNGERLWITFYRKKKKNIYVYSARHFAHGSVYFPSVMLTWPCR